jgi:hypothetical protein
MNKFNCCFAFAYAHTPKVTFGSRSIITHLLLSSSVEIFVNDFLSLFTDLDSELANRINILTCAHIYSTGLQRPPRLPVKPLGEHVNHLSSGKFNHSNIAINVPSTITTLLCPSQAARSRLSWRPLHRRGSCCQIHICHQSIPSILIHCFNYNTYRHVHMVLLAWFLASSQLGASIASSPRFPHRTHSIGGLWCHFCDSVESFATKFS